MRWSECPSILPGDRSAAAGCTDAQAQPERELLACCTAASHSGGAPNQPTCTGAHQEAVAHADLFQREADQQDQRQPAGHGDAQVGVRHQYRLVLGGRHARHKVGCGAQGGPGGGDVSAFGRPWLQL